mgnify:CR=1 FL=1
MYEFKIALTHEEIDDLLFLQEEEKLARDVYLYSYNKYNVQIFKNISNSEIQHMNNVLQLLNKYNLQDSASPNIGEFHNVTLQSVYNELIIQSDISLLEALKIGDKIEDLDIRDIGLNEARTSKLDILSLYSTLKCGSRNHLRNFNNQFSKPVRSQSKGNKIYLFIKRTFYILYKSLISKEYRVFLFKSLTDKNWYKEYLISKTVCEALEKMNKFNVLIDKHLNK